jgi:hypothetical protein
VRELRPCAPPAATPPSVRAAAADPSVRAAAADPSVRGAGRTQRSSLRPLRRRGLRPALVGTPTETQPTSTPTPRRGRRTLRPDAAL